ncbi:MAG: DNA gyrase inhibitor YacG [Betaproteobacteria bacterium]|nr:DNA gyrase inhibitor YacG [Betaproteobacteria bacterium]
MKPPRRLVPCPTCGRLSPWDPDNRSRPFCSERCKLIDLGQWAQDRYAIPLAQELPLPADDTPSGN